MSSFKEFADYAEVVKRDSQAENRMNQGVWGGKHGKYPRNRSRLGVQWNV